MNSLSKAKPPALLYITGKDPEAELSGGHSSFVRAHARASCAAGLRPDLICLSSSNETRELPYGRLHCIAPLPERLFKRVYPNGVRTVGYIVHRRWYVRGVEEWLRRQSGPVCIHGFSIWMEAALEAVHRVHPDFPVRTIVSHYTSQNDEYRSKLQGARGYGPRQMLKFQCQLLLSRFCLQRHERRTVRESGTVAVNYQHVRNLLEKAHGEIPHCRVVPYCSELAFNPPLSRSGIPDLPAPLQPGRPLLVCVSRHDPRKGVGVLIRALAELKKKGGAFNAVLIGLGELIEEHRQLIKDLELTDCTVAAGFVEDLGPWLQAADVYILPSLGEQSGSVSLLEAMQFGTCCVSSGVDGMLEDIEDGRDGRLVPPGDVHGLADVLHELIQDAGQRSDLGRAARDTFERRFHPSVLQKTVQDLYLSTNGAHSHAHV